VADSYENDLKNLEQVIKGAMKIAHSNTTSSEGAAIIAAALISIAYGDSSGMGIRSALILKAKNEPKTG
jgi:ADP-ribosylglycohydrolase